MKSLCGPPHSPGDRSSCGAPHSWRCCPWACWDGQHETPVSSPSNGGDTAGTPRVAEDEGRWGGSTRTSRGSKNSPVAVKGAAATSDRKMAATRRPAPAKGAAPGPAKRRASVERTDSKRCKGADGTPQQTQATHYYPREQYWQLCANIMKARQDALWTNSWVKEQSPCAGPSNETGSNQGRQGVEFHQYGQKGTNYQEEESRYDGQKGQGGLTKRAGPVGKGRTSQNVPTGRDEEPRTRPSRQSEMRGSGPTGQEGMRRFGPTGRSGMPGSEPTGQGGNLRPGQLNKSRPIKESKSSEQSRPCESNLLRANEYRPCGEMGMPPCGLETCSRLPCVLAPLGDSESCTLPFHPSEGEPNPWGPWTPPCGVEPWILLPCAVPPCGLPESALSPCGQPPFALGLPPGMMPLCPCMMEGMLQGPAEEQVPLYNSPTDSTDSDESCDNERRDSQPKRRSSRKSKSNLRRATSQSETDLRSRSRSRSANRTSRMSIAQKSRSESRTDLGSRSKSRSKNHTSRKPIAQKLQREPWIDLCSPSKPRSDSRASRRSLPQGSVSQSRTDIGSRSRSRSRNRTSDRPIGQKSRSESWAHLGSRNKSQSNMSASRKRNIDSQ